MPVKRAVFEVDVQGSEKLTQAYRAMAALREQAEDSGSAFSQMTSGAKTVIVMMGKAEAQVEQVAKRSRAVSTIWKSIRDDTHAAAGSVRSVVTTLYGGMGTLLRWTGIGAALGGLATGGAVWGLERLATSANYGRRAATGLGVGYGQHQAFGLAYQRLVDAQAFLGGISTARGNVASGAAGALYTLGMDPGRGGTSDLANEALGRARALAQSTPEGELGFLLQSHRLGELGLGIEDLRRLKYTSDEEFGEFKEAFRQRAKQLELSDKLLKRWQDLDVQLDAAGQKIKNALIGGLEALTKPLSDLSEALGNAIVALAGSKGFKWVLDKFAGGLQTFANYVGSEKFQTDLKVFFEALELLGDKLISALRWLGVIPGGSGGAQGAQGGAGTMTREAYDKQTEDNIAKEGWDPNGVIANRYRRRRAEGYAPVTIGTSVGAGAIGGLGLGSGPMSQDDLLALVKRLENSGPRAVSPAGAIGTYQIMPITAKTYGFTAQDMYDPDKNQAVARMLLSDLAKRYNNNVTDMLVGYNWGSANADKWIKNGRDMSKLPQETQDYLRRASVSIKIENNTGGNATTNISQMGVPVVVPQ